MVGERANCVPSDHVRRLVDDGTMSKIDRWARVAIRLSNRQNRQNSQEKGCLQEAARTRLATTGDSGSHCQHPCPTSTTAGDGYFVKIEPWTSGTGHANRPLCDVQARKPRAEKGCRTRYDRRRIELPTALNTGGDRLALAVCTFLRRIQ